MSEFVKIFSALAAGEELYSIYWNSISKKMKEGDPLDPDTGVWGTTDFTKRVDELRFYDELGQQSNGAILCSIPVIPDDDNTIRLESSGAENAMAQIKVATRCFIGSASILHNTKLQFEANFQIALATDKEEELPVFTKFGFHSCAEVTKFVSFKAFLSNFVQYIKTNSIDFGFTASVDNLPPIRWSTSLSTHIVLRNWTCPFLNELNFGLISDTDWFFCTRFNSTSYGFLAPEFSVICGAKNKPATSRAPKGFSLPVDWQELPDTLNDHPKSFPSPQGYAGFESEFRIVQRYPFNTGDRANDTLAENRYWSIEAAFPLSNGFFDKWNTSVVDPLTASMNLVDRASKLSGIPKLIVNSSSKRAVGNLVYSVKDAPIPHFGAEIFPVSIRSIGHYPNLESNVPPTYVPPTYLEFPSIISGSGKRLEIQVAFQSPRDIRNEHFASKESHICLAFMHSKERDEQAEYQSVYLGALRFDIVSSPDRSGTACDTLVEASQIQACLNSDKAEVFFPSASIVDRLQISEVTILLAVSEISPAGQDPLPGEKFAGLFESDKLDTELSFEYEDPIVFLIDDASGTTASKKLLKKSANSTEPLTEKKETDLTPTALAAAPGRSTPFFLSMSESLLSDKNHTIDVSLYSRSADVGNSAIPAYFVIDRNPFFIGRVELPTENSDTSQVSSQELAKFSSRDEIWETTLGSKFIDLILPPQGVGEAAEKRRGPADIEEGKPIDFRFTPASRLTLQTNYFDKRFVDVPWNLRRVMGYAGQRDPGCSINSGTFELFYGLRGNFSVPASGKMHKIAELSSLVGAAVGRYSSDPINNLNSAQENKFRLARLGWAKQHAALKSRLAVLEVRNGETGGSSLVDGLTFDLRQNAQMKFPVDADATKLVYLPQELRTPNGLAGGVAWIFDSAIVYDSLWADPKAFSSNASELKFSALGGWGSQTASFNKGLISISTSTTMGRTHYIKVEVHGRINIGWNRARHVIVYERTVLPTRQFFAEQDLLKGMPVLRKAQEYVEIDDLDSLAGLNDKGACFQSLHFDEKVRRFNVNSSWGRDIFITDSAGKQVPFGWTVPLWNPSALPADVYPMPPIFIKTESAAAGQSDLRGIKDPEKLCFFFLARNVVESDELWSELKPTYGDARTWYPIPGIDCSEHASNACELPNPGASLDPTSPNPSVAEAYVDGLSQFTFTLLHSSVPTNVVATKSKREIGAAISNMVLMRGPIFISSGPIQNSPREKIENCFDLVSRTLEELQNDASKVREVIEDNRALINRVLKDASDRVLAFIPDSCDNMSEVVASRIERQLRKYESRMAAALGNYAGGFSEDFRVWSLAIVSIVQDVKAIGGTAEEQLAKLKEKLLAYFDISNGVIAELRQKLCAMAGFSDDILLAERKLKTEYQSILVSIYQSKNNVLAKIEELAAANTAEKQKEILDSTVDLVKALRTSALGRLSELKEIVLEILRPIIGTSADALGIAFENISSTVTESATAYMQTVGELKTAIDEGTVDVEAAKIDLSNKLDQFVNDLNSQLESAFDSYVQKYFIQFADRARELSSNSSKIIHGLVTELSHQLISAIHELADISDDSIENLIEEIGIELTSLVNPVKVPWDKLKIEVKNHLVIVAKNFCEMFTAIVAEADFKMDLAAAFDLNKRIESLLDELDSGSATITDVRKKIDDFRRDVLHVFNRSEVSLGGNKWKFRPSKDLKDNGLKLIRAFGAAPDVSGLAFDLGVQSKNRLRVAYSFFDHETREILDGVGISPCFANPAESAMMQLSPLNLKVPTVRLLDRVIPYNLEKYDLGKVISKLSLFDCENLFSKVKLPSYSNDSVKITHGVDPQSKSGWMQAEVNVGYDDSIEMLSAGGLTIKLANSKFHAISRTDLKPGQPPKQHFNSEISGHFRFMLGGRELLVIEKAKLLCDQSKKITFDIKAENVKLQSALSFLSDLINKFNSGDNGFRVDIVGASVKSTLNLPLADVQFGTFGITNLKLGFSFSVGMDSGKFFFASSLSIASPERPFTFTVFILGGAGWFDFDVRVVPGQYIETVLSVCITASASLGVNLGPVSGAIAAYFGVKVEYRSSSKGSSTLIYGIVIIFSGHVDVMRIASADIALTLEANYSNKGGGLVGRGTVKISIKICWCFTLHVNKSVSYKFGNKSKQRSAGSPALLRAKPARGTDATQGALLSPELLHQTEEIDADEVDLASDATPLAPILGPVFPPRDVADLNRFALQYTSSYEW